MAAHDVAQQPARRWPASSATSASQLGVLRSGAGDHVALQRHGLQHPPRQPGALPGVAHSAASRPRAARWRVPPAPTAPAARAGGRSAPPVPTGVRSPSRSAPAPTPARAGRSPARGERELGRHDAHPVQRLQQRHLAGVRERRAVQPLQRPPQPLPVEREVGLLGEHLPQQRPRHRRSPRARRPPRPIRTSHARAGSGRAPRGIPAAAPPRRSSRGSPAPASARAGTPRSAGGSSTAGRPLLPRPCPARVPARSATRARTAPPRRRRARPAGAPRPPPRTP